MEEKKERVFVKCPKCGYTSAQGNKCGMCGKRLTPVPDQGEDIVDKSERMSQYEYDKKYRNHR